MRDEETPQPALFTLTDITGRRRDDDREVHVYNAEFNRRTTQVVLQGAAVALLPTMLLVAIVDLYALLLFAAIVGVWSYLRLRRDRKRLGVTVMRSIVDRRSSAAGRVYQGRVEIGAEQFLAYQVVESSVPAARRDVADDVMDLFGASPVDIATTPEPALPDFEAMRHRQPITTTTPEGTLL